MILIFLSVSVPNAPNVLNAAVAATGAQVIIEKPLSEPVNVVTSNTKPAQKVILWPNNVAPQNVAYFVRPQPMPTPINVIRPSYMAPGGSSMNNTSLITNVLKPVMTTGIYDHQPSKKVEIPRMHPPAILPKPPVVSVAPTMTAKTSSNPPSFIVTTTLPSKITTVSDPSLFGTTKYPIQLVQAGNVFRTLQPLNNNQVTQIAKVLKNKQGYKDPEIVYEDTKNRRKLVYKIVCKEDVQQRPQEQRQIAIPNAQVSSSSESSEDEDDSEEIRTSAKNANEVVLNPHDVLKMTDPAILRNKRKRGRPSEFEKFFRPSKPKKHSKTLKNTFGLTYAQAEAVENDIVDDKTIVNVELKEEPDEDDEAGQVLASSYTRSGRLSRPPRTIVPNVTTLGTPVGSILDMPNLPPPPPPPELSKLEPKSRRKFTVPDKYRCRVCHKIYLGDRKMAKHIKNFPGHGPIEYDPSIEQQEQQQRIEEKHEENTKKMPNLSMPIIPLARTQLEELVKNLDAELVLDCVSKKMFDNFNMWELQLKKMQLNKNTGIKRVEIMLQDMEHVLVELKKMVDNCLTHTKLCDKPAPSVTVGEHLQLALNSHDGPLYLEQPNHIPEEYHKYFGIQALPLISSPRSESNTLVTNPEDDENSNSMMSGNSEKEGMGAQMVLEQNLGLQDDHDEDEDSNSKKTRHESSNSKIDDTSLLHDEESNEKSQQKNESESTIAVTSTPQDQVTSVTSVTTAEQQPQRTRLPSFSSIIAGSPKPELQDICLVGDTETPQVPDDHHSNPSNSRRGSIESDTRPSLDIRRCSLDQSFTANLNNPNQDSMGRRASVDNGLMIRSTLETGFVESFSTSEMLNLEHPVPDCPYTASTASVTSIESPVISSSIMSMNTLGTPAVSTIMTSIDSTHVTFSQQLVSGVQSLPPSGPPSVQGDPRHASMPSSPLGSVHHGSVNAGNPPVSSQNQNSSNFLISELESVLGTGGDFSFTTPSPEKLLPSIPPSSMMIKSEESDKNSKKSQRTDFLGALKESSNKEATKETKDDPDQLGTGFDDSQSNDLIRSTLVDVTHPVSFASTSLSESKNDDHHHDQPDTLSQLFEEITDAQEAANNQDNKE